MSYKTIQINGKQLRLHRYLMEQKIGRKLTFNEVVHHINQDKHDNRIENLEVISRGKHIKMHPEVNKKSIKSNTIKIDVNKIKELRKTMTIEQISKYFNVATMTIWYRMKKNNIKTKKLDDRDIKEIRELLKTNEKQRYIAKKYNVSEQLISNIKHNKRYGK